MIHRQIVDKNVVRYRKISRQPMRPIFHPQITDGFINVCGFYRRFDDEKWITLVDERIHVKCGFIDNFAMNQQGSIIPQFLEKVVVEKVDILVTQHVCFKLTSLA